MFFNKEGILNLDEMVMRTPSWQKIMEDGIVTEEEVEKQAEKVTQLLHKIDDTFSEDQKRLVGELLMESSVLFAAYQIHSLQKFSFKS